MSSTPPATVAEVAAQLARVRDGLRSQRDAAPETARTDYDRGQLDGAVTGLGLALRLLGRLPDVDVEESDLSGSGDVDGTEEATILPFERP